MELKGRVVSQQVDYYRSGLAIDTVTTTGLCGFDDLRLLVTVSEVFPSGFGWQVLAAETKGLIGEDEPVRVRVGKCETRVISAGEGAQGQLRDYARSPATAAKKLIASAPPCLATNSSSRRTRSIQLTISKNRMKLDLPDPSAPIRTVVSGNPVSSTSARDLKPANADGVNSVYSVLPFPTSGLVYDARSCCDY